MSAVVRRATRLSGTFAVLTGGSNDDLQRKVYSIGLASCAPRAARRRDPASANRKRIRCRLPAVVAVRSSERRKYDIPVTYLATLLF